MATGVTWTCAGAERFGVWYTSKTHKEWDWNMEGKYTAILKHGWNRDTRPKKERKKNQNKLSGLETLIQIWHHEMEFSDETEYQSNCPLPYWYSASSLHAKRHLLCYADITLLIYQ